jgi:hypothetical protein
VAAAAAVASVVMARMSQWFQQYLEKEGLARLTITMLFITTAGCLAYTWGYAEVRNFPTALLLISERPLLPVTC